MSEEKAESKFEFISAAELATASFRYHLVGKPKNEQFFEAEWYCQDSDCVVREVTIHCKLLDPDDKEPRKVKCPACGSRLTFHGYIMVETIKGS